MSATEELAFSKLHGILMTSSKNTAFTKALESHGVQCKVVDVDFQRTIISFGAIDTHYIIQIRTTSECDQRYRFKTFRYKTLKSITLYSIIILVSSDHGFATALKNPSMTLGS